MPIDTGPSNLPMVWNPSVSAEGQMEIGLTFVSKLGICDLPGMSSMFQAFSPHFITDISESDSWEACWKDFIGPCVGTDGNANLSGPQKELLTWHWKLGISMQRIQEMMRENKAIVSPQYHVVFDDLFQTVFSSGGNDALVDTICNNLFDCNRDVYAEGEFDSLGNIVYHPPPLDNNWLDESKQRDRRVQLHCQKEITEERERSKRLRIPAHTSPPEPAHDDDTEHISSLSIVSDSDDDDSDNDDSDTDFIAPSHQEGEVSDPVDSFDPGGNVGVDEQEHVSPQYPWRNRKKKQPLVIDFDNKRHNVFACSKSQDIPVGAYKCAAAHKRTKYRQRLKQWMEESDHMLNAMEL
jgi:hypothetical protein